MKHCIALLFLPILSCTAITQVNSATKAQSKTVKLTELSAAQKVKLGKKIWQNESGGSIQGLTHWNDGEEFPSMGIGHFIWYPKGFDGKWIETFPLFIQYAVAQKTKGIPQWVLEAKDCPWDSKATFYRDFNTPKIVSLRRFLANNIQLQADFIIARSRVALPKILKAANQDDRQRIEKNYSKVSSTVHGTYALIDYVNFKGEGTSLKERYNGQGWGLLQVLSGMNDVPSGHAAAVEFSKSAKRVLLRRVKNAPPSRNEGRWTAGWNNRCDTYAKKF